MSILAKDQSKQNPKQDQTEQEEDENPVYQDIRTDMGEMDEDQPIPEQPMSEEEETR